jgi:ribosomal protein S18 acetylase RimI-like enzyme
VSGAEIRSLSPTELSRPLLEEVGALYRVVWGFPTRSDRPHRWAEEYLPQHARSESFRFLLALRNGRIIGYTYGYTSHEGQWTTDQIICALDPEARAEWIEPRPFEVVTIAVDPGFQRQGIGTRLLTRLLAGLPHSRAILWTEAERRAALAFYASQGWRAIVSDVEIESRRAVVLGKPLRLSRLNGFLDGE